METEIPYHLYYDYDLPHDNIRYKDIKKYLGYFGRYEAYIYYYDEVLK